MFMNINHQARMRWRDFRAQTETRNIANNKRRSISGDLACTNHNIFHAINFLVRLSGLYPRGKRNAHTYCVTAVDFVFSDLPTRFDDYSILHLSDLHIGKNDDMLRMVGEELSELSPDLVVVTGDFQTYGTPIGKKVTKIIAHLVSNIRSRNGWIAVLGNHDSHDMLDALEAIDVRVLANESVVISRGDDALRFVGTDDVHAFYSPDAVTALEDHQEGFRIALIHTVDLATTASRLGYNLYLSGHTHGGQICFPGGRPVLTALDSHRHLASGRWRLNGMQGYTNRGLGFGLSPLRFNCPGEATLIRLIKG